VEGFHNKAKLTIRRLYGLGEFETIELAMFHQLGGLPQPELTHRFRGTPFFEPRRRSHKWSAGRYFGATKPDSCARCARSSLLESHY
jgi:hypothetical protein